MQQTIIPRKYQLVWAKLKGYPWWPSYIQSYTQKDVTVVFLGEFSYASLKLEQICDFKENYSKYIKNMNQNNQKLKQAAQIGMKILEGKSTCEEERKLADKKSHNKNQQTSDEEIDEEEEEEEEEDEDDEDDEEIEINEKEESSNQENDKNFVLKQKKNVKYEKKMLKKNAKKEENSTNIKKQDEKPALRGKIKKDQKENVKQEKKSIEKVPKKVDSDRKKSPSQIFDKKVEKKLKVASDKKQEDKEEQIIEENNIEKIDTLINLASFEQNLQRIYDNLSNLLEQQQQQLFKDLDIQCQVYEKLQINCIDYVQTKIGKLFNSLLLILNQNKSQELENLRNKIENIVENIKQKVLHEALGFQDGKELCKKQRSASTNDCTQPAIWESQSDDKSSQQVNININQLLPKLDEQNSKQSELDSLIQNDDKKCNDELLRKKVCKKMADLIQQNYLLDKTLAKNLCIKIENKIRQIASNINNYKIYIRGLIRLLKNKKITIKQIQDYNKDELIKLINKNNEQNDQKLQNQLSNNMSMDTSD